MIKNMELANKILNQFSFREFNYIKKLLVQFENNGEIFVNIDLVMISRLRKPNIELHIRFFNVRSLLVKGFDSDGCISGFDVCDVSSNQMENISWQVLDYENGDIAFYAQNMEIVSCVTLLE